VQVSWCARMEDLVLMFGGGDCARWVGKREAEVRSLVEEDGRI
jgi:hypothetical protein